MFAHLHNLFNSAECQSHTVASPSQGGSAKRQGKKKKNDRKLSVGEKVDARLSSEATKDSMMTDQSGNSTGNTSSSIQNGTQQQLHQSQMSPGSKSSTHDSKALQMAALTHALSCMKKFHKPLTGLFTLYECMEFEHGKTLRSD